MTKSVSPFTDGLEWKYWDGSAWNVDKSLKVSRGPRSNVCYNEGKSYDIGATFISADCKSRCTCQGHDNINCVSLCPSLMVKCKPNEEMKHTDEPAQPGSKCTCKTPVCVPKPRNKCPNTHKYAYFDGRYCCKYNREKVYSPEGSSCDGSRISWKSTCCLNNAFTKCPRERGCRNAGT